MRTQRQRILRVVLSVFLLLGATLAALSLERRQDEEPAVAAPATSTEEAQLTLKYGRQKIQLTVTSVSPQHEQAILQTVREQFVGVQPSVDFQTSQQTESNWEVVTGKLLYLVAATNSAEAVVNGSAVSIRGTSTDAGAVRQRLAELRDALPAEAIVDADILITNISMSSAELCALSFAPIAAQTIHFRQASTQLRDAAAPILDRLIEFTYDCPDSRIAIIGHTDSTGEEALNIQISLARAAIVADYVTSRGVAAQQLILEGAGSAQPIGDNDTVAGRERNRRIEFKLR